MRRRLVPAIVGAALALAAIRFVASGFLPAWSQLTGDFAAAFPARAVARLRPDFVSADLGGAGAWNYGPVMHLVITLPLLFVPSWSAVPHVWAVANLLFVTTAFVLTIRFAGGWSRLSRTERAFIAAMWLGYQPLAVCFAQGNIELSEFAFVLAGVVLIMRGRRGWAGATFGFAAMIKYLPIGFVGWLALRRRWRECAAAVAVVIAVAIVAQLTIDWRHSITLTQIAVNAARSQAYGLHDMSVTSAFLHWSSVPDWEIGTLRWFPDARHVAGARAGTIASLVFAAAYTILFVWRGRRPVIHDEIAVLLLLMFLLPPWNHEDFFIFALVPLTLFAVRAFLDRDHAALAVTVGAYLLISPIVPYGIIERLGLVSHRFAYVWNYHNVPFWGVLILLAVATDRLVRDNADVRT